MVFSKIAKPTTSFTKSAKPTSSFVKTEKPFDRPFFLLETGGFFLLETGAKFVLEGALDPDWDKIAKP